ncbi:hypothetical protein V1283_003779 [Bradyrhizobium sp. AZCC 2262]|uniref:hypothetical protein n=1 Tax=Bradyrhizobium sp. AZCC 2262 TaxID=3117022 RepID=UPI002FF0AA62
MTYFTSRAQDAAQKIKEAQIEVETATRAYSRGVGVDALNQANRKLADAHNDLYIVNAGRCEY